MSELIRYVSPNQKPRRYRTPKLKDGELRVYWGRLPHDSPDIIYSWQGHWSMKPDSRLLCLHFGSQRPDPHTMPIFSKMLPSLLEELGARGYDLKTFRFSIMKKQSEIEKWKQEARDAE